jgi:predicted MPP superfamily phosphohydrolase
MRGPYAVGGNHLYVNRGLGMGHSLLYPRHGAPPELTLFTLESREVAS